MAPTSPELPDSFLRVLDLLDARECELTGRRLSPRLPFRRFGLTVEEVLAGENAPGHRVIARDLSKDGIGFVHRGKMALGTPIRVTLICRDGTERRHLGTVMRCEVVTAVYSVLGVKWERPIQPADFLAMPDHPLTRREIARRTLLHLDTNPAHHAFPQKILGGSGWTVMPVSSLREAVLQLASSAPGAAIIDGETDWVFGAIPALRATGLAGPIVLTERDPQARRDDAQAAGFNAVVQLPFCREELLQAIAES